MNRKRQIMNYIELTDCERELKSLQNAAAAIRTASHTSYGCGADLSFVEGLDVALDSIRARIQEVEKIETHIKQLQDQRGQGHSPVDLSNGWS